MHTVSFKVNEVFQMLRCVRGHGGRVTVSICWCGLCNFVYVVLMWLIWLSILICFISCFACWVSGWANTSGATFNKPFTLKPPETSPLTQRHNHLLKQHRCFQSWIMALLSYDLITACDFNISLCVSSHGCPGGHQYSSIHHALLLFRFANVVE